MSNETDFLEILNSTDQMRILLSHYGQDPEAAVSHVLNMRAFNKLGLEFTPDLYIRIIVPMYNEIDDPTIKSDEEMIG